MGTTTYTQEIGDIICERIAAGESLRRICGGDDMPAPSTVFKWLGENEAFSEQYAQARVWQAETLMDEIIEIADDSSQDTVCSTKGTPMADAEWIGRSKIRVDARFKLIGQLAPKKYGPKMALTGADGGPLQVETTDARAALLSRLTGDKE